MLCLSFAILWAFSSDLDPIRMSCFRASRIASPVPMFPVPPSMPIFIVYTCLCKGGFLGDNVFLLICWF